MRIVSNKFKDYYDVVANQGVDLTRIFNRNTKNVKGNFPLPGWTEKSYWDGIQKDADYPKAEYTVYYSTKQNFGSENYRLGYIYVLFAGKLYGGIAIKDLTFGHTGEMSYYWDIETFNKKALEMKVEERKSYTESSLYCGKGYKTNKERVEKVLSIEGDEILKEWAITNNISIAVACYFFTDKNEQFYKVNPCLKDIEFQRVLDPFTAYQELDQWISGVLGQNPEPDEVSDKVKIQQHGFDSWSFRKHKLDNTKDRKK
jgi:hypothetical protein